MPKIQKVNAMANTDLELFFIFSILHLIFRYDNEKTRESSKSKNTVWNFLNDPSV